MPTAESDSQRSFAIDVVQQLRAAGYVAYWAGGCVRDNLLGRPPKDYDVATSATPAQISRVFRQRKTLQVGAAFGVVVVIGGPQAGQIDVATFRHDVSYSDGRRPDQVVFSDPEQDALRRDFTINGLFYDPIADRVIDYVGGQEDIRRRVVRAIGDPRARFEEDKLRMLRAARFSSILDFELDEATRSAAAEMAGQISAVSAERIAQEMRAMLAHASRAKALATLRQLRLLAEILPEAPSESEVWPRTLRLLELLREPGFAAALTGVFWFVSAVDRTVERTVGEIAARWRLSNKELERMVWLARHRHALVNARDLPWPRVQRLLISPGSQELLALHEAAAVVVQEWNHRAPGEPDVDQHLAFCRDKLRLPPGELDPPPLITGEDLLAHGIARGPNYKWLLDCVRDAQLERQIGTREQALALVVQVLARGDA